MFVRLIRFKFFCSFSVHGWIQRMWVFGSVITSVTKWNKSVSVSVYDKMVNYDRGICRLPDQQCGFYCICVYPVAYLIHVCDFYSYTHAVAITIGTNN